MPIMFLKNYIKNVVPLNIGYKKRVMRLKKLVINGMAGDDELEKYISSSEKLQMIATLSKMEGYENIDAMKLLKKQLKGMSHEYRRFADSQAGKETLPDELLVKLMTQNKLEKAEQAEVKEKATEKHQPEAKKQMRKKKEENREISTSTKELLSRLTAAEMELKELRSSIARRL